mmetsp:Transcript_23323/g.64144  ORF Transcript_23323/g.64144 Transcript_23323/m.64144 type:complete len:345 (-) Transcript_23323:528-1562(-)
MRALVRLGNLLPPKFPYKVCKAVACDGLPRLVGRAEAEMLVERSSSGRSFRLTLMLDGYAAPITAGNFVDLVQRGFYNGLPVTIAVDEMPKSLVDSGGVVASGQPSMLGGDITGFVDPRTGDYRQVPLERWLEEESEPVYEIPYADEPTAPSVEYRTSQEDEESTRRNGESSWTSEEGERRIAQPTSRGKRTRAPFCVAGSIGMVHSREDLNDGSSEFFILTRNLEPNSVEARDLEARYALFGFVLEGAEHLADLSTGDVVSTITLKSGRDNLRTPGLNPTYARRSSGKSQRDYGMLSGEGLEESTIPADIPAAPEDKLRADGYVQDMVGAEGDNEEVGSSASQ